MKVCFLDDFERQTRNHLGKSEDNEFNFNEVYEEFCSKAGVDETPEVNTDQRMIVVGSGVKEKLGSVALWLREHTVDITVIELRAYKDGDSVIIEPAMIVPLPVSRFAQTGKTKGSGPPWVSDGRTWHLEKRCSVKTCEMFLQLDDLLGDNLELEGPRWNQKHYVSYRVNNYNWLAVITGSKTLRLDFLLKKGALQADHVAEMLGVEKFDKEESLAEKMNLPSSVLIVNRNEQTDRLYLRVKEDFDLSSDAFVNFLQEAYKAFPK